MSTHPNSPQTGKPEREESGQISNSTPQVEEEHSNIVMPSENQNNFKSPYLNISYTP